MGSIFSRSEKQVINGNLNSISWLWMRRWYPRPGQVTYIHLQIWQERKGSRA